MNERVVLKALEGLSHGVTEIYLHPATISGGAIADSMPDYRHAEELEALLSPRVRVALARMNLKVGGFADLFEPAA